MVQRTPAISTFPDVILVFSASFLGGNSCLLVNDVTFGAALLNVSPDLKISQANHMLVSGKKASCWGVYAPRFDSAYVVASLTPTIATLDPTSGNPKGRISFDPVSIRWLRYNPGPNLAPRPCQDCEYCGHRP